MGKGESGVGVRNGYYYNTDKKCIVTISRENGCVLLTKQGEKDPYKEISSTEDFSLAKENLKKISTAQTFNKSNYSHFN